MTTFGISTDNYITVFDSAADAESQPETEHFSSAEELAALGANWPASRLIEIWNNLPGVTPVKKFTDRQTAVARIWKAIQEVGEVVPASAAAEVQPEEAAAENEAEPVAVVPEEPQTAEPPTAESATVGEQASDVALVEETSANDATPSKRARNAAPRAGSKTTIILELLKREGGATLQELMDATGWQKHSVRGFLAGTVNKKMGLALTSVKREDGTRVYSIPA